MITVIGVLLTRDGLAQRRELTPDRRRMRTRSWASSALEMPSPGGGNH
jgi:hypothetical protein